jgi:hypothetical protein
MCVYDPTPIKQISEPRKRINRDLIELVIVPVTVLVLLVAVTVYLNGGN